MQTQPFYDEACRTGRVVSADGQLYRERELQDPTLDTLLRITAALEIDLADVLKRQQAGQQPADKLRTERAAPISSIHVSFACV
jgi:hypothetical protein